MTLLLRSSIIAMLLSLAPSISMGNAIPLMLRVSTSDLDPWAQDLEVFSGTRQVHIWLLNYDWEEIEFGLESTFEIVDVFLPNGIVNVGTMTDVHLLPAAGPILPGNGVVLTVAVRDPDGVGGSICMRESVVNGRVCARIGGTWTHASHTGLDTDPSQCEGEFSSAACATLTPVETVGWGRLKADYR